MTATLEPLAVTLDARGQRIYSDDDRAAVLAVLEANNGDFSATANDVGVPDRTIRQWAQGHGAQSARARERKNRTSAELADRFERIAWIVSGMIPAAAKKARDKGLVSALSVTAGVAVDKANLLRGMPTSISGALPKGVDLTRLTDAELEQYQALLKKARGSDKPPDDCAHPAQSES